MSCRTLASVYHNDALAREQKLSPEDRLRFHQERSGPIMQELQQWMKAQIAEHRVEPNSGLGKAFSYLLKHWTKLTLFLSQPGAPLDNNVVERALKKAILNRRNALFYKTMNGEKRVKRADFRNSLATTKRRGGLWGNATACVLIRFADKVLKEDPKCSSTVIRSSCSPLLRWRLC
jgi:hypothetical protein